MHVAFNPVEKQSFNFVEKIGGILTIESSAKARAPKRADWLRNTLAKELMRLATTNRPRETQPRSDDDTEGTLTAE